MTYSVGGDALRKRRRLNCDLPTTTAVCLSDVNYLESFDGEITKKELFIFHNLPWPPVPSKLLSLSQGRFIMERRVKDLDFSLSEDTPQDGDCMVHWYTPYWIK